MKKGEKIFAEPLRNLAEPRGTFAEPLRNLAEPSQREILKKTIAEPCGTLRNLRGTPRNPAEPRGTFAEPCGTFPKGNP